MEEHHTNPSEATKARNLYGILAVAMLALSAALAHTAVIQLRGGRTFSGCVSAVGTVLFLVVAVIMAHDLHKRPHSTQPHEEEKDHGSN